MADTPEKRIFVLQGGGALGAYQAGAYQALHEAGLEPDWVAGISIGAINASLIAGNKPEQRVAKLRSFWERVSSSLQGFAFLPGVAGRSLFNEASSNLAMLFGIPGFFTPQFPPPFFAAPATPQAQSFYDNSPLAQTLCELVDFDVLNNGDMRLSAGTVNIKSGNFRYFDTRTDAITPAHIMASTALPPGFPPVMIEGEAYWDGGLVSNTPLHMVLDDPATTGPTCIFQIDLFSAKGDIPQTMAEVLEREKEIRYSSRTRLNTTAMQEIHRLRSIIARLAAKLPPEDLTSLGLDLAKLSEPEPEVTILHLINRATAMDTQSKDYEFSRLSIEEHWEKGQKHVQLSLSHPEWLNRQRPVNGMRIFDLANNFET